MEEDIIIPNNIGNKKIKYFFDEEINQIPAYKSELTAIDKNSRSVS